LALTPPDEFVGVRNQLAKQRKADGDADTAKQISALRRGSWTDWALNAVADADPDLAQRYVDAAGSVRRIQSGAKGDLRQALRDLRQLTTDMTRAASEHLASRSHTPDLLELAERLSVVGGSDTASARLLTASLAADVGKVDAPEDAVAYDAEDDDERYRPTKGARRTKPAKRGASADKPEPEPHTRSAARSGGRPGDVVGRRRLEHAVRDAQESVDDATAQLADADAELERAIADVEAATQAVAEANAALNAARRRQIDAKRQRDSVRRDVVVASKALDRAGAALAEHGE
jgi:hypothetical protein